MIVVRQQRVLALQRNVNFSPFSHHTCIGSGFHGKSKPAEPSHRILSEWPAPKTKQKPVKVHGQFRVDYTQLTILAAFVL